ncbi:neutral ceramidase isoform X2 [Anabrus simplex]|uniref:neutral ceramidase isoform X2 n=1 Tax=Anabrus simplex TaxID=316456 RepID=UPI0035A37E74
MKESVMWTPVVWIFVVASLYLETDAEYTIGVGIADVTGPPAEVTFMGYAKLTQKGRGIHLRQFSRAFIVDDGNSRFVFVSVDCGMIGNGLRREVINMLKTRYGSMYTEKNVMLSGTHTHSTPGGFLQDLLFDLSSLGFVKETFIALVSGIALSVRRAHEKMVSGRVFLTSGELLDVSINRSPPAYDNNPETEKRKYKYNVDKTMTQLRFISSDDKPLGVINWYAVHATSMNNTNRLVSSDNLGYACILFEKRMNPNAHPGKNEFVAAFASSNEGDVSPNIRGPRCQRTGRPCEVLTSSCPKGDECVAYGPGRDMFESTRIIAQRLTDKAWELWGQPDAVELRGPVGSIHQFVDMPKQEAQVYDEETKIISTVRGCSPAMGYSFAAGTTDGPGEFSFKQGTTTDNPLWNALRDFLATPSVDDIICHAPKPILLATGSMTFPIEWQPRIVSTMLGRIGNLIIACVPGEFTTMSGRRMRAAVKDAVIASGGPEDTEVVIAGLCNTYSDYVVTPEEYQIQRYEGASTIYGPNTLTLYLSHYSEMAGRLVKNQTGPPGPEPPELMNDLISLLTPVVFDSPKWGHEFGDVLEEPEPIVREGDTVRARFVSANPRNNMMHGSTYLTVERREGDRWVIEATDADWETKFLWERTSTVLGNSEVTVLWDVAPNTKPGKYRIRHFGYYKYIFGGVYPFTGTTSTFEVKGVPSRYRYGSGRRIRALY